MIAPVFFEYLVVEKNCVLKFEGFGCKAYALPQFRCIDNVSIEYNRHIVVGILTVIAPVSFINTVVEKVVYVNLRYSVARRMRTYRLVNILRKVF